MLTVFEIRVAFLSISDSNCEHRRNINTKFLSLLLIYVRVLLLLNLAKHKKVHTCTLTQTLFPNEAHIDND